MKAEDISSIKSILIQPKNIVIVPHKNPDGDAIGSCLGLYHFLVQLNHQVTVIAPNDYPHFLKWMPGNDTILIFETDTKKCETIIQKTEIIFTLDFNALFRTGEMEAFLKESKAVKIMIDHHQQPEDYANYLYSDVMMSSTAEMVYHFISKLSLTHLINTEVANCLYTGVMTDTGSFRFPNTSSTTHRLIAELIDKGANNSAIYHNVYDNNTYQRTQLLGRALSNLHVLPDLRTAYIVLSQNDLNEFNFKKGDTEGFVNYGLTIEGIIFAAIFIESEQDEIIKISFRSKGLFDVNSFSRTHFGGGGHMNAAGGKSELSLTQTVEKFISILPQHKSALTL